MRASTHLRTATRGGVRVAHVNASNAPTPRAGTYSRSSLHREEWKIYIKPSEKSTTHPEGGGARTCVRFKRAVAAPALSSSILSSKPRGAAMHGTTCDVRVPRPLHSNAHILQAPHQHQAATHLPSNLLLTYWTLPPYSLPTAENVFQM